MKSRRETQSAPAREGDVAVIVSRYNASVTDRLREGAVQAWMERVGTRKGATPRSPVMEVIEAPGSYELTALSLSAASSGRFAGVVALGCIIKGDTRHDEYIAHAVANGLTNITIATGVPVAFGVITAENARQARDRAGGRKGNKGREAMDALLDTIAAMRAMGGGAESATSAAPRRRAPDKAAASTVRRRASRRGRPTAR